MFSQLIRGAMDHKTYGSDKIIPSFIGSAKKNQQQQNIYI